MLTKIMFCRLSGLIIVVFLIIQIFFLNTYSAAEIYKYIDREGVIHYSDRPKNSNYKLLHVFNNFSYSNNSSKKSYKNSGALKSIIDEVANKYGQDSKLIQTIISKESDFNANAVSPKGAMGLMQLMPETAKRFNVKDPFHPKQNIEGGVAYFDYLMKLFNNDIGLALAAYNAGENNVINYSGIPPFKETQDYVRKVLNSYNGSQVERINKIYKIIKEDGTILLTTEPDEHIYLR